MAKLIYNSEGIVDQKCNQGVVWEVWSRNKTYSKRDTFFDSCYCNFILGSVAKNCLIDY